MAEARTGIRATPWPWLAVAAIVLVGLAVKAWPHHHQADRAAAIQQSIGATSCDNSGYYVQSQLDGSKQIIYDCQMASGNWKCVTENGGIASDSTAEVKLLFTNTLSGGEPFCATSQ